jgi:alkylation response protein AidB-like acyl-CoA dehydrogenase
MPLESRLPAHTLKPAARPDFAEILQRVRKLHPEIEARALAAEKAKRVPAETMEALRDADVFRLMQPKRFGGYEYGPAELAQIGFELGRALLWLDDIVFSAQGALGGMLWWRLNPGVPVVHPPHIARQTQSWMPGVRPGVTMLYRAITSAILWSLGFTITSFFCTIANR